MTEQNNDWTIKKASQIEQAQEEFSILRLKRSHCDNRRQQDNAQTKGSIRKDISRAVASRHIKDLKERSIAQILLDCTN